jgi:hypothetical protein
MRTHPSTFAAAIVLAGLTLTACATEGTAMPESDGSTPSSRPPFRTASPAPLTPPGAPAEVPEAKWSALVSDLAARGVSGDPTLVSAERVEFANGSLGCPQPGMSYTQALVNGYRIVVRTDDRTFDYRFGRGDEPRLCER